MSLDGVGEAMTGRLVSAAIAGLALTALVVAAKGPAGQAVDLRQPATKEQAGGVCEESAAAQEIRRAKVSSESAAQRDREEVKGCCGADTGVVSTRLNRKEVSLASTDSVHVTDRRHAGGWRLWRVC